METVGAKERLEAVIRLSGVKTKKEFARKTGISESTISQITSTSPNSRQSDISEETARKVVAGLPELHLSTVWLVNGTGEMYAQQPDRQPSLFSSGTTAHDFTDSNVLSESSEASSGDFVNVRPAEVNSMPSSHVEEAPNGMAAELDEPQKERLPPRVPKPQGPKLERIVMFYFDGTVIEYRPRE